MDSFIGAIQYVAFPYVPNGWALCNGQLLTIRDNQPLFSLLGKRFGGDGNITFGVPNLVDAPSTPKDHLPIICLQGYYPPRP